MEILVSLLERKNLCFRSFLRICESFLDDINKGDLTKIGQFQTRRSGIISVLEKLDGKISELLKQKDFVQSPSIEDRELVARLLSEKDALAKSILDLDLQILKHIDRVKDETIRKLQEIQAGKRTLGGYKSSQNQIEIAEGKNDLSKA